MEKVCKAKWLVFSGENCCKVRVYVYGKTREEYDALARKHWSRLVERTRRLYPTNSESIIKGIRLDFEY